MKANFKARLPPFQEQFIRDVYEPEDIDNPGVRLVTNGTFSVGRKNGKSELAGALVLVHLIGPESEPEGEIISGATTAKQAKVVFRAVNRFLKASPNLAKYVKIVPTTSTVYVTVDGLRCSGSRYEAIAAGPDAAQGLNPSLIILDELGFARNRNFFDAMAESQGARDQPFMMNISTQNKDDNHVLSTTIDAGLRRRDGAKCGGKDECSVHKNKSCAVCNRDQRAVVHLYAADPECDLLDEAQWYQSNPALGVFIDYKRFKARAQKAFDTPSEEASFRLYRLNQRVSSITPVIAAADWKACQMASVTKPAIHRLQTDFQFEKGEKIFGGLDMSGRTDLTALSAVSAEDITRVKTWFWKPSEALIRHGERDGPQGRQRQWGGLMAEPSLAIAKAVDGALGAIHGLAVYTRIPPKTPLPYVEIGQNQIIGEDDAGSFFRAYVEVSVYAATTAEMKAIAGQVFSALNVNLTLDGFTCHEFHYDGLNPHREMQGSDVIEQGIMTFEYLVQTLP